MAHKVVGGTVWFGGSDLSGDATAVTLMGQRAAVSDTVYGSTAEIAVPGLARAIVSADGYFGAGGAGGSYADDAFTSMLNGTTADQPLTVVPAGVIPAAGVQAFGCFLRSGSPEYAFTVNQLGRWSLKSVVYTSPVLNGALAVVGTQTASGTGTTLTVSAVGATQRLYASLHVFNVTGGGTLTVSVQTAPTGAFASPTSRITFAAVGGGGGASECQSVAGPITDTYLRASWTLTGTSPTANFAVFFDIR